MSHYLFERSLHVSELGGLLLADSQSMDVIEANDRQWMGGVSGCLQQRKEQNRVHYRRNMIAL